MSNRKVIIIAGPNGAGKTTFAQSFLPAEANVPRFINADLIAAGLAPFAPETAAFRAGRLMLQEIDLCASRGEDFAFETTLSGFSYLRRIAQWRAAGYRVKLFFLSLPNVETAIERVASRVRQGGHDIPEAVIRRRFAAGLDNFHRRYKLAVDDWKKFNVPGSFKDQDIDFVNGVVWLRKTFDLTAEDATQDATLWLGAIVDGDEVYVNGTRVGQTGYRYPPRIYPVPANVLAAGENIISIRLTSYSSDPGFVRDKKYALTVGEKSIDLEGEWRYQIGMRADAMPASTTLHYQPGTLFKAKLAPAFPFNIKGVIWSQGESNVTRSAEYYSLFSDMIHDWRAHFNQGDFPFLYAQLANFLEPTSTPGESEWAQLREAQRQTLAVPNTAMAVTIDTGEWNDIHPLDKETVGERLALAAQKLAYGDKSVIASGPQVKSVKRKGKHLLINFDSVGKGLVTRDGELKEIAIAGADKKFVWAKAEVKSKQLRVWSEEVSDPVWVRYAWADNPEHANLYNSAGLPASPFEARVKAK